MEDKAILIPLAIIAGIAILWVVFHELTILCKLLLPIAAVVALIVIAVKFFSGS